MLGLGTALHCPTSRLRNREAGTLRRGAGREQKVEASSSRPILPIGTTAKRSRPSPEEPSMSKSRRQPAAVSPRPTPRLALSIPEFCEAHGISEGLYYKLKKQGEGPREMK